MESQPTGHPKLLSSSDFAGRQELALTQLTGFEEDPASARAFERRYFPIAVLTVLVAGAAFYVFFTELVSPWVGVVLFMVAWLTGLGAVVHARFATPTSLVSGRPMLRFRRSDGSNEETEQIYVCPESRTYFCRVTSGPS